MIEAVAAFTEKLYERYGKVYASWLLAMLSAPSSVVAKTRDVLKEKSHGEYIATILTISIAFGVTVGALIPNRPEISSRAVVFIVVSLLWLFLSLLVHGFCRLVGGKEIGADDHVLDASESRVRLCCQQFPHAADHLVHHQLSASAAIAW